MSKYDNFETIEINQEEFESSIELALNEGKNVELEDDELDVEILSVDDGMGCNVLGMKDGKYYWVDRHWGVIQVTKKLVDEIVERYS